MNSLIRLDGSSKGQSLESTTKIEKVATYAIQEKLAPSKMISPPQVRRSRSRLKADDGTAAHDPAVEPTSSKGKLARVGTMDNPGGEGKLYASPKRTIETFDEQKTDSRIEEQESNHGVAQGSLPKNIKGNEIQWKKEDHESGSMEPILNCGPQASLSKFSSTMHSKEEVTRQEATFSGKIEDWVPILSEHFFSMSSLDDVANVNPFHDSEPSSFIDAEPHPYSEHRRQHPPHPYSERRHPHPQHLYSERHNHRPP
jgi:hypothetical protein